MKYRADIDGLRAVAVIPVILFHLDVAPFTGGFVGVDIFFVISGFLITSIILDDLGKGTFSLARFYERRARRILPTLFLVMAVSTVVAMVLFLPEALDEFSQSLAATAVFSSNLLFWQQTGYFDAPADLKPLLHTWSLAIEEQFYLLYPLLLLCLVRLWGERWVAGVLTIGLASFLLSSLALKQYPAATFYLLPFRGWELLLGAVLASGKIGIPRSGWLAEAIAVFGLALIAWPIFTFTEAVRFPGLAAAIPCLGAAALIYAGTAAKPALLTRLLQMRYLVLIGLISYPLYLWHWPAIVFYKYWSMTEPGPVATALLIALVTALAVASSWYLERPIRKAAWLTDRRTLLTGIGGAVACTVVISVSGMISDGWPLRISPSVLALADMSQYRHGRQDCHQVSVKTQSEICVRGAAGKAPDFILVGDSHADAMSPGIFAAAAAENRAGYQFTDGGYRPAPGFIAYGRDESRDKTLDGRLLALLKRPHIKEVYLTTYWANAVNRMWRDKHGSLLPGLAALSRGLAALVAAHPNVRFVFIEDNPASANLSPGIAAQAIHLSRQMSTGLTRDEYEKQRDLVRPLFSELATLPNVTVISIADQLCAERMCPGSTDGQPMYRDAEHLSPYGAMKLKNVLRKAMDRSLPEGG